RRHFAGFHELLEAAQIFSNRLRWLVTEQPRDGGADLTRGRVVLQPHANFRTSPASGALEHHRAGADQLRAGKGAPGDQLAGDLVDDLGVPLDAAAGWPLRDPM